MDVPLAAHRSFEAGEQALDVWRDGRRERVKAPFLPYCFSRQPLPGALRSVPQRVRPLGSLQPEPWFRNEFPTVLGVRDASQTAPPRSLADDHVAFVERVLIDEPGFFRRFPNTQPLRVLVLDVEQSSQGGRFPTARDPVLSVAWALNDEEPKCVLGPPPGNGGAPDDSDVLLEFLYAFQKADPDVVVGYNVADYDLRTLLQRCAAQGIDPSPLTRDGTRPRVGEEEHLAGRVVYDVFDSVKLDQTLYGIKNRQLKTVAAWMGYDALREDTANLSAIAGTERLARYNKNDVDLTRKLSRVYFRNFVSLAEFYGAPLNLLVRATSSFHTATLQGRVFAQAQPRIVSDGRNDERYPAFYDVGEDENPFEAAIVEIYRKGLFKPLWKLDFSSMFPSVLVSLGAGSDNTTLVGTEPLGPFRVVRDGERRRYHIPDRTRRWNIVVQVEGRSAMAQQVKDLITHRLQLKAEAKRASGEDRERLQARQSALKIILNSIYGVNASRHARYGSLPVALAIVGVARQLIRYVEEQLGDAKVETDSLAYDEPIWVRDGDRRVHLKAIGDLVRERPQGWEALSVTRDGVKEWRPITGFHEHDTPSRMFQVHTPFGLCRMTESHSVFVTDGSAIWPEFLKDIRHPVAFADDLPLGGAESVGEDFAYLLGLFVAEGSLNASKRCVSLSMADQELVAWYAKVMGERFGVPFHVGDARNREQHAPMLYARTWRKEVYDWFVGQGIGHTSTGKRVPTCIWNAPAGERRSFLRGLFDGDGQVRPHGTSRLLTTTSYHLANEVAGLLRGLGRNNATVQEEGRRTRSGKRVFVVRWSDHDKGHRHYRAVLGRGFRGVPMKRMEESPEPRSYDISVAVNNNFVHASGMILHNTDGVYTSAPVDAAQVQKGLEAYVAEELGAESHLGIEAESFAAGFFHEAKTYLLLHHDGRLEKHGGGFKGSSLCGVHDKSLDALARCLLEGKGDPREVAKECLDLARYEPRDFVMRVRVGKEAYKSENALSAQLSRAWEKANGDRVHVGQQLEYVRTTYGFDVPSARALAALDKRYYREMVQGIVEKLGVEAGPRQRRLVEFA